MTTATLTPIQLGFIDRVNEFVNIIENNGEGTNIDSIIISIRDLEEKITKHIDESLMTDSEKKLFYEKINDSFDSLSTSTHTIFLTTYEKFRHYPLTMQTQIMNLVEVIDEIWNQCAVLTYDFSTKNMKK